MMIIAIFLLANCLASFTSAASVNCDAPYECSGTAVSNGGSGTVSANGYKSISGSSTTITVSGTQQRIYIQGEFGCYETGLITTSYFITCNAGNGAHGAAIDTSGVSGYASNCFSDTAIVSDSSWIYCHGDHTCSGADISGAGNILAYGSYSLTDATINSDGSSPTITFYGYYAGYNAVINCESGDSCSIVCYGNGCFGLQLNCTGSCSVSCDDSNAINSDWCPVIYDAINSTVPDVPSNESDYSVDLTSLTLNNMANCELESAVTFGDSDNPAVSNISSTSGNICCQADYGCDDLRVSVTSGGYDIVCGGISSCAGYDAIISTEDSPGRDIYCTGRRGCQYATVIGSGSTGTVYCTSMESCEDSTISNAGKLYCSGGYSNTCKSATINGVQRIYATGWEAMDGSIINSDGVGILYVYFASYQAAGSSAVTIICQDGDTCYIYCKTIESCTGVTVYSCGNNSTIIECDSVDCPNEVVADNCPTETPAETATEDDVPAASSKGTVNVVGVQSFMGISFVVLYISFFLC